jgi:hypothetical protein
LAVLKALQTSNPMARFRKLLIWFPLALLVAALLGILCREELKLPLNQESSEQVPEALTFGQIAQGKLARTEADKDSYSETSKGLLAANDFVFVLGQGSGWHGYNVLRIDSDGHCEFTYGGEQTGKWKRASFALSSDELVALKSQLIELNLFASNRAYLSDVHDGTQWFVKLQANGRHKAIYCSNYFPAEVVKLSRFLADKILPQHKSEIDVAATIELKPDEREHETW